MVKSLRVRPQLPRKWYSDDGGLLIPPSRIQAFRQICAQKSTLSLEDLLCCYLFFICGNSFPVFSIQISDWVYENHRRKQHGKRSPGDDCGKRQMERESKTPTSLIGTLETGGERERDSLGLQCLSRGCSVSGLVALLCRPLWIGFIFVLTKKNKREVERLELLT